jgi:hypothetical protein
MRYQDRPVRPRRYRTHVYILLLAVIIAAIVAYYLPGDRPQVASVHSYKEYIQLVEKKHEERLEQAAAESDSATAQPAE